MEIETSVLTMLETILVTMSIIIMSIAMYYGIALKTRIPKELASLNLIIYALSLMVVRRLFHFFAHFETLEIMHFVEDAMSLMIAIFMLLAFKRMYSKLREENNP